MKSSVWFVFLLALTLPANHLLGQAAAPAQVPEDEKLILEVTPSRLDLEVGQTRQLTARVTKASSREPVETKVVFFSGSRRSIGVNSNGEVSAYKPGKFKIYALVPRDPEDVSRRAKARARVAIPVTVPNPPVESVRFQGLPGRFYASTHIEPGVEILDESGAVRLQVPIEYSTSQQDVASFDEFGRLSLHRTGSVRISASAEGVSHDLEIMVVANPAVDLELQASPETGRTGDVIHLSASVLDSQGRPVSEMPVNFSVGGRPSAGIIAPGAHVQIDPDGTLVAERPGIYSVVASSGNLVASRTIRIGPRDVRQRVELVGHGAVRDRHTSDLWVWEGVDGRDYAITGTWSAAGHAYIWDVTSPRGMSIVDVVRVDARTVNDVKVSANGKIAAISREGASNRKNGFVLLDVSAPATGVRILSSYDDQLTGGVHNLFIYENHVFALSAGRRYDIINIEDPTDPYLVGRFELDTPGHGIHDVWVVDGIAYSSNWSDGVVAVDVGGGGRGGSLENPVFLGSHSYPSGWNHASFPYRSESTGKFYVFMGDEAFPEGMLGKGGGLPTRAAGWIHVIEFDDWTNSREVARYQVPEAGSHNFWVEDDILYIGYYNGGLRVVDVSGEMRGDLYRQGREIAFWHPHDPEGFVPNAPFVWGAQPFKGHIYLADWNSGLWAVKLKPGKKGRGGARYFGEPR